MATRLVKMNLNLLLVHFAVVAFSLNGEARNLRRRRRAIVNRVEYDLSTSFRPIRITVVRGVTDGLNSTQVRTLDYVVAKAVDRIESIVNVSRVVGKLRLARPGGCKQVFTYGVNMDKCASVMEGYRGDFCLDDFKIPNDHQVGLKIYGDSLNPNPVQVIYEDGYGLDDTDMVLYVQAISTAKCVRDKVVAYAKHCQQDQFQRPIAGYANFCPEEFLSATIGDVRYAVKTAIHELIHVLGFTVDLFRLFQKCEPINCPPHRVIRIQSDISERHRLISPTLSRLLKEHFDCHQSHQSDFGALLQSSTTDDSFSSHWDPIFLQGSIMTPAIDKLAYLSLLDPFTLAVLQDTGWYTVNFSRADPYLWGKGKGCNFGVFTDPTLTCTVKEPGCHYLHMDKAKCGVIPGAGNLQIAERSCLSRPTSSSGIDDIYHAGEAYSGESRCFMAKIAKQNSTGTKSRSSLFPHCFGHRCNDDVVEVDFGNGWFPCPFGKVMTIDSTNLTGEIRCPAYGPLCGSFKINVNGLPHVSEPVTTSEPTTSATPSSASSNSSPQTVGLVFGSIPWEALYDSPAHILMLISQMEKFLTDIGVPNSSFATPQVSLYFNDSVVVLVTFTPSSHLSTDAFVNLLGNRLSSKQGISLSVYYSPFVVTKIEPPSAIPALPPSPFQDNAPPSKAPLITAAVCGAISAIAILMVIGFCFRIKTPKRPASMTSADGISLPPAGVYPLNSRTLFLSNSEVDAKTSHHPYVHPHHLQHMDVNSLGRENPIQVTAV